MAKYLARSCPRCSGYLGIVMRKQHGIFHCKLSTGAVLIVATDSPGYSCKAESQPCGSALLVVHPTTISLSCSLKKAARNAPKCHYSRLYRAGVFVPVGVDHA